MRPGSPDRDVHPLTRPTFMWMQEVSGQGKALEWIHELTITSLTEKTGNLALYCDLAKIAGPRGTTEGRNDATHTFSILCEGGELAQAMLEYHHKGKDSAVSYSYLSRQIPSFLYETRLPEVWQQEKPAWFDYGRELGTRALWRRASRQEWVTLAEDRLAPTLKRNFPKLERLFHDMLAEPSRLAREYQKLADQLLPDIAGAVKLPFWQIEEVEVMLDKTYGRLVTGKSEEGASTDEMLALLHQRVQEGLSKRPAAADEASQGEESQGPKSTQVMRAMQTDHQVVQFEAKALPILTKQTATLEEKLNVLSEAFTSNSLPPKAVLLAAKGQRMTNYTAPSDFLAQLHEHRHLMGRFLAMSLTFDVKAGKVPPPLRYLLLEESVTRLICEGEWGKLDPFNDFVLRFKGEMAGTKYERHDTRAVYHDPGVLAAVREVMGRLFDILGYPEEVDPAEGVSYRGFMDRITELLELAQAMERAEQAGAFQVIDESIAEALRLAGLHFIRLVYTLIPADRKLTFWLAPHEPVLARLDDAVESSREQITWRRRQGTIHGQPPTAPPLLGHTLQAGKKGGAAAETPKGPPVKPLPPAKKARSASPRGSKPKPATPTGATPRPGHLQGGTWNDPPDVEYFGGTHGKFYANGWTVDWPGVCKHFGWDHKQLHGPWVMAPSLGGDWKTPDGWKRPVVDGKPFRAAEHGDLLAKAGLRVKGKAAGAPKRPRGREPGKGKGGAAANKAPHFG